MKNTEDGGHHFNYVYNYTDHLGNIRLSYGYDPEDHELKILEENNYYPFGLRHNNYNMAYKDYVKSIGHGIFIDPRVITGGEYKFKFQGQERQDELGLNWDSFKYRNYDYAIGRFMSIDPLAEKYGYQSPYNFSEDRVIDARELEGLEKVLTKDLILRTVDIQLAKPQNTTPGVPIISMGYEGAAGKSVEEGGAGAEANIFKGRVAYNLCVDKNSIEYSVDMLQTGADVSVAGQTADASYSTAHINGSYNIDTKKSEVTADFFTADANIGGDNQEGQDGIMAKLQALGVFVEVNVIEVGHVFEDAGNTIMSYLQGLTEDYFNANKPKDCEADIDVIH